MRCAGHVACMGNSSRSAYRLLVGKPDREYLEQLGIDWRITLKCIFKK
jgi:hypothetical protein